MAKSKRRLHFMKRPCAIYSFVMQMVLFSSAVVLFNVVHFRFSRSLRWMHECQVVDFCLCDCLCSWYMHGFQINLRYYANFHASLCELCTDFRMRQEKRIMRSLLLTMRQWSQLLRWRTLRTEVSAMCVIHLPFCHMNTDHIFECIFRSKKNIGFRIHDANSTALHYTLTFIVEENNQAHMKC